MMRDVEMNGLTASNPFISVYPPPPVIISTSDLTIQEDYCKTTNYKDGDITNICTIKSKEIRVLIINNCPTLSNAYALIKRSCFVDFFYSLPHAFVLILKCNEMTGSFSNNFSTKYKRKRPMIISFESQNDKIVFFKNYGDDQKFQDVERAMNNGEDFNFAKFLNKLNIGKYGYYSNHLLEMTIKNEHDLINKASESFDLLTIRFLHLFDRDLKPKYELINRIIKKDFENTTLDGFLTIFDYNFLDLNSDELNGDKLPSKYQNLIYSNHNDMNFLMLSVKCRNKSAVEFIISHGVDVDYLDREIKTAADYAYENKDYDILTELIYANSTFPHNFNPKECTNFKELLEDTAELHTLVGNAKNYEDYQNEMNGSCVVNIEINQVDNILAKYPNLRHFYDIANKSVATTAIMKQNLRTYHYLLSRDIYIGPFEELKSIKNHLSDDQVEEMRLIHSDSARDLPENHLSILLSNSYIGHDGKTTTDYLKYVKFAFKFLNDIETIKPILEICAAQRNFKIIFDFNRESVEYIDPGTNKNTYGVFHLRGCHIYIGAKQLLSEDSKLSAIASLAHELTHFAMLLTYDNNCNPYSEQDAMTKGAMTLTILKYKMQLSEIDPIVQMVFINNYKTEHYTAEFIVRAPHMTVSYYKDQMKLENIKVTHSELFNFYNQVLEDVKKKKVIVGQRYDEDLALAHGIWEKKRRREKFIRHGLIGLTGLLALMVSVIAACFIVFYDPCISDPHSTCSWDDLTVWSQRRIMSSLITYQGKKVEFKEVFGGNSEALNKLPIDLLKNPENININDYTHKEPIPYYDRQFIISTAELLRTKIGGKFKDINRDHKYDYNSLRDNKTMIIAGEPLDGRTSVMRKINRDLRNSTNWVTLIEFKNTSPEIINTFENQDLSDLKNLINFITSAAELLPFESEIFKVKLDKGEVIILIDGIDSIYPHHENLTNNLLSSLELNFKNKIELWITTRDSFKSNVERIFNARSYKLLPLDKNTRINYIELVLHNKLPNDTVKINTTIDKLEDFFNKIEIWRDSSNHRVYNIFLLNAFIDNELHLRNSSLYNILDVYIDKILANTIDDLHAKGKSQTHIEGEKKILQKISMAMIQRLYEKKLTNVSMTKLVNANVEMDKLEIGDEWDLNNELIMYQLHNGILINDTQSDKVKVKFIHKLILEFFTASFIKKYIIAKCDTFPDKDFINFLFHIAYDVNYVFAVVRNLIEKSGSEIKGNCSSEFRNKFEIQLEGFYKMKNETQFKKIGYYLEHDEMIHIAPFLNLIYKNDSQMMEVINKLA